MLTLKLGILSSINLGAMFLFQWYVLTQLGAGVETDALFAGMTVPQLVLAVVGSSLTHVLVPVFSGEKEEAMRTYAWTLSLLVCGFFGLSSVLLYFSAPWWVPLTVPGFDEAGKLMTLELTRIQLIGLIFSGLSGVQLAACNAKHQFLRAEFISMVATISMLLLLVWVLPRYGVFGAAWLGVVRVGMQAILLVPTMGPPIHIDIKSTAVTQTWVRIKPLLLGAAYYKSEPLIDRLLLSFASNGSISLYYFGQQLFGAATQVICTAAVRPLVPVLSECYKKNRYLDFWCSYRNGLFRIAVIAAGGLVVFGLWGGELLGLLVGHGSINSSNVHKLWLIMICLSGAFFGGALALISTASLYSLGNTKTPTVIGMYSYTVYLPLKVLSFFYFGAYGLAVGSSIFYLANFFIQRWCLDKEISNLVKEGV